MRDAALAKPIVDDETPEPDTICRDERCPIDHVHPWHVMSGSGRRGPNKRKRAVSE